MTELQFCTATQAGDICSLLQILSDGFDPNYTVNESGKNIKIGEKNVVDGLHFDCLDLLLSRGMILSNPGRLWKLTLCYNEDEGTLKNILLKHNISIDSQDREGETILWEAIYTPESFKHLLEQGANPTVRDYQGRNIYEYIIYKLDLEIENQLFYHLEREDEERYYEYEPEFFTSVTLDPYVQCLEILRTYSNNPV